MSQELLKFLINGSCKIFIYDFSASFFFVVFFLVFFCMLLISLTGGTPSLKNLGRLKGL